MSKKEKVQHVRTPKGKSPRQLAKAAENTRKAQERLKRLQAKQQAEQAAKRQATAEYVASFQKERNEAAYVDAALNGPSQNPLKSFLAGRKPTYQRVKRFFDTRPHMQHSFTKEDDLPKAA
ncbi:MAG: hypothetical protein DWQ19_12850 [Crenarchaeota archaeon]|nr:MAG: hypothetical protein DWQ19_12850 [Thermoproteota archaeon]